MSDASPLDPELRELAVETFNEHTLAGLAVGVVRGGVLDQFNGVGLADADTGREVSPTTIFRIGSITQTMTAVAVMQLVEAGAVGLDDPASIHLRSIRLEGSAGTSPPTIRHLLTHTAGIGELRGWRDLIRPTIGLGAKHGDAIPSLVDYHAGELRSEVPPGTKWAYANHGFALLGQLVEDVTGEPFAERLRTKVFEPLGMRHADVVRTPGVVAELAVGYALSRGRLQPVKDQDIVVAPAGSTFASTSDLARFVAAVAGGGANGDGRVLSPPSLATMLGPQADRVGQAAIGLGFFLDRIGDHPVAGHDGGWPGFVLTFLVAPAADVGIVALTNTSVAFATHSLAERLLVRLLDAEQKPQSIPEHPHVWTELTGVYRPPRGPNTNLRLWPATGGELEVVVRRGHLLIRAPSPLKELRKGVRLHAASADDALAFRTRVQGASFYVAFERTPDGSVETMRIGSSYGVFGRFGRRSRLASIALWERAAVAGGAAAAAAALVRRRRVSSTR